MAIKKVVLFSPYFPPNKGGVSDYTHKLKDQLESNHHEVLVIAGECAERQKSDGIIEVPIPCDPHVFKEHLLQFAADELIIQYTPLAFNPRKYGYNLWLWRLMKLVKPHVKVRLYAHESNYPINFSKYGLTLGPLHVFQFHLFINAAHSIFFSTKRFENYWRKRHPSRAHDMHTLPIGSNILPPAGSDTSRPRRNQIVYFGGHHDTQYNHLAMAFMEAVAAQDKETTFVILGLKQELLTLSSTLAERTRFPGYISEEEISQIYLESKLSLLPLMDGCSTRRTTLMCALSHGVPIITNLGESSDPAIPWQEFCFIKSLENFSDFKPEDYTGEKCQEMGAKALEYYLNLFDMYKNCNLLFEY